MTSNSAHTAARTQDPSSRFEQHESAVVELDRSARVYIAGHRGLAGSAIWRSLAAAGFTNLIGAASGELDLRDRPATFEFMRAIKPQVVVDAAARVGGIAANSDRPYEFLSDNLRIQLNVMDAANTVHVDRLLFLGSSCIYPKLARQPIQEDSLMTGPLEPTNYAYAVAKIAGITQVQAVRRQYGRRWISAMPTNLYGPGDNFNLDTSHVLPALIRRFHEAKLSDDAYVRVWGTGTPKREFLYADDLGDAVLFLLEHYDAPDPINVGTGQDLEIRTLARLIADTVGFRGSFEFDTTKPDGTPRKLLDVSRLNSLGWRPRVNLADGIAMTYAWYVENHDSARL